MYSMKANREKISRYLEEFEKENELSRNDWGADAVEKLFDLARKGKMVRGSLLVDAAEAMGRQEGTVHYAAALELVHTGLLIHDDIIDRDELRRGVASAHVQYRSEKISDRQAENLAICAGDIAYFLSYQIMSREEYSPEALSVFSSTFSRVGAGEMADVTIAEDSETTVETVLEMYRDKTACYTFSLPLRLASIAAKGKDSEELHKIGMKMGVLYQIKDDHLDLFNSEEETGKPEASDLMEGKETVHTVLLRERTELGDEISGRKDQEKALELAERMIDEGVKEEVEQRMDERRAEIVAMLDELENSELRELLLDVLQLVLEREK